jgi:hypothetical protein
MWCFNLQTSKQFIYLQPLRQTKRTSLGNGEILKRPTRADCKSAVKTSQVRILLSPQKSPDVCRDFFIGNNHNFPNRCITNSTIIGIVNNTTISV